MRFKDGRNPIKRVFKYNIDVSSLKVKNTFSIIIYIYIKKKSFIYSFYIHFNGILTMLLTLLYLYVETLFLSEPALRKIDGADGVGRLNNLLTLNFKFFYIKKKFLPELFYIG